MAFEFGQVGMALKYSFSSLPENLSQPGREGTGRGQAGEGQAWRDETKPSCSFCLSLPASVLGLDL